MVHGYLEYDVDIVPRAIEFISAYQTDGDCYATCFTDEGALFACGTNGITLFFENFTKKKLTSIKRCVTSMTHRAHGDAQYFLIHHCGDVKTVRVTTDLLSSTELFKYDCPGNSGEVATVGSAYVAATSNNSLVLFNKRTKEQHIRTLRYSPHSLQFLEDDSLLVTGDNSLRKYRLSADAKLEIMWRCGGLNGAKGLSITSNKMIVTTSSNDRKLNIVSAENGKIYFQGALLNHSMLMELNLHVHPG